MKLTKTALMMVAALVFFYFFSNNNLIYLPFILLAAASIPHIIKMVFRYIQEKRMLKKLSKAGMKDVDKMDGLQFEVYLKALLKELGYKSSVTKGSSDFGADLIMKSDRKKIAVQAKRYGYKNKVGIDAVQQIFTAKTYYAADECCIITNSMYTNAAIKLAKACGVKLYDRYKLTDLINKINPEQTAKSITESVEPQTRKCPECKGNLIKRTSKKGNHFMGCSNFPGCRHTEPIAKK